MDLAKTLLANWGKPGATVGQGISAWEAFGGFREVPPKHLKPILKCA